MRGIGGAVVAFVLALSMTASVVERAGRGAHLFDLGPAPKVTAGQVLAVELQAPSGIQTARHLPKFTAVYVTRIAGDRIAVFPNATPIAGCLLIWSPPVTRAGAAFTDPCEGGQWDSQGRYLAGREQQDLLRLPVTVSDAGNLIVDTLNVADRGAIELAPTPEAGPIVPGMQPAPAEPEPAPSEWVLVPLVARPAEADGSGLPGVFVALGRQWSLGAGDAALLVLSWVLLVGSAGFFVFNLLRRRTAVRPAGAPQVYLEWRMGRRWSLNLDTPLTLQTTEERRMSVRLANLGRSDAAGATVTFEVESPLSIHFQSRFGVVTRSVLPGEIHVRWEFRRRIPGGARSPRATLRLTRIDGQPHALLAREVVVRCRAAGGGSETRTVVLVRFV